MTGSANPFVGPRPLEAGERIWGRDQEILDLDNLLAAERIVLFHSPSGAGKSSLLQAGLLPRLGKSYDVWGPTRVHQQPAVDGGVNRYVLSAVQGLEEGVPTKLSRPSPVLAGQTLHEYLEHRPHRRSAPDNVLLVFDQFEEVLTVDPLAVEAKREFFGQLGELLRNPRVWALFALREDYLAPLDPYARSVPSHFRNRFRIDLLGLDGARQAMVNSARQGGREFAAAEGLAHDLATLKVQQADGSFVEQTGGHVEPMQLQVVCRRLWDALPADQRAIEAQDLERFGDVTEALAGYYADSVARIAGGEARERALREWFGEALITAGGSRGQVVRGVEHSEGLENDTIARLLDTHLVRAEQRAGATWYELAHDRLIEPVRDDNAAWRAEHLAEVQQLASLWERQGRPSGLLLRDVELEAAERWADGAAHVTDIEERFLGASRQAQAAAERDRRQARRIQWLAIAATIAFVLALGASIFAYGKWQDAETQKVEADTRRRQAERAQQAADEARKQEQEQRQLAEEQTRLAEQQTQLAEEQTQRAEDEEREARKQELAALEARDDARESQQRAEDAGQRERQSRIDAEQAGERERQARVEAEQASEREKVANLNAQRLRLVAEAKALAVRTLSMQEPTQKDLAALLALVAYQLHREHGGGDEDPDVYKALQLASQRHLGSRELRGHRDTIRALAVTPEHRMLASGSDDGDIRLTDLGDPQATPRTLVTRDSGSRSSVRALAFDPRGELLVAGGFDGSIRVWDRSQGTEQPPLAPADSRWIVESLAFRPASPAGELAVARSPRPEVGAEASLEIRSLEQEGARRAVAGNRGPLRSLAFSADGGLLAAAGGEAGALVWTVDEPAAAPRILGCDCDLRSLTFSGAGNLLAGGSTDGRLLLWTLPAGTLRDVPAHAARIESLAFHPRRDLVLASASFDGTVRLWNAAEPEALPVVLEGHRGWVWSVVFHPRGEPLISASSDKTLRLWTTRSTDLVDSLCASLPAGRRDLGADERDKYLSGFPADAKDERPCPEGGG